MFNLIQEIIDNEFIPQRAHHDDAGYDLRCYLPDGPVRLDLNSTIRIRTGVTVDLSAGSVGLICPRSSASKNGLLVHLGVVDAGYKGELMFCVTRVGASGTYRASNGDRLCQLVVLDLSPQLTASALSTVSRGANGFGSTGK